MSIKGEVVLLEILRDRLTQAAKIVRTTRDAVEGIMNIYEIAGADKDPIDKLQEIVDCIDEGNLDLALQSFHEYIESFKEEDFDMFKDGEEETDEHPIESK